MNVIVYIKLQPQIAAYLYSRFAPGAVHGTPITIPKGTRVPWEVKHQRLSQRECRIFGTLDEVFIKALFLNTDITDSWKLYGNAYSLQAFNYARHNRYAEGKHVPTREDLDQLIPINVNLPSDTKYLRRELCALTLDTDGGTRFVEACKLMFKNSLMEYVTRARLTAAEQGKELIFSEAIRTYCEAHNFPAELTENLRRYSYRWDIFTHSGDGSKNAPNP